LYFSLFEKGPIDGLFHFCVFTKFKFIIDTGPRLSATVFSVLAINTLKLLRLYRTSGQTECCHD
jgi:hypothetical protein